MIPFKEVIITEDQAIDLLVPKVEVSAAKRDTTDLMKQVMERQNLIKVKRARSDFGQLLLSNT